MDGKTDNPPRLLLEKILVLEAGDRIAVGACGGLLAQLGATVVAVEPGVRPTGGKWRNRAAMMAGKLSVVIDAENSGDSALRDGLLAQADVVLSSSDFGSPAINYWNQPADARQIVVDITAYGHGGADEGRGGSEEIIQARGGVIDTTGPENGPPMVVGTPVLEMSTAVSAAAAILLALRVRRLHGCGQRIDMSILDGAVSSLTNFLALHFNGIAATRSGNRHPLYSPWGSYRAVDGHLLVCSVSDDQFVRICRVMGDPALAHDPRFATATLRSRHFVEIDRIISAWTAHRTVADCAQLLTQSGVACGPIATLDGLEQEPNLIHRATLRRVHDPDTGTSARIPASPLRGTPLCGLSPSRIPARDEDRAAVLEILATRVKAPANGVPAKAPARREPLAGVRVVEIGHYTVAPLAGRHLGSFGAEVIKIEPPVGDAIRFGPPLRSDGLSYIFALSNTDKRGLILDLRQEHDKLRLHRLLAQSDLLIENQRPGLLASLGFSSELLRARHPHLVYCSISGFGRDSAYPGRPALDTVIQAMSGMMSLTCADGVPTKAGISASDVAGGLFGLLASLAGIEYRDQTGHAAHFDISMQDTSVWMTQIHWSGEIQPTTRIVRASDGYVVAQGDAATIDRVITTPGTQIERTELSTLLCAQGLAAAPILTVAEVVAHPSTVARQLIVERPTADNATWHVLNSPLRLCSTPPQVRTVMPRLGFDNNRLIDEFKLDAQPVPAKNS